MSKVLSYILLALLLFSAASDTIGAFKRVDKANVNIELASRESRDQLQQQLYLIQEGDRVVNNLDGVNVDNISKDFSGKQVDPESVAYRKSSIYEGIMSALLLVCAVFAILNVRANKFRVAMQSLYVGMLGIAIVRIFIISPTSPLMYMAHTCLILIAITAASKKAYKIALKANQPSPEI